uniref:Uncharacterized protein n=1 Tax=Meloidogyne javanica TaxID=6303 RepID=A0A915N7Y6_MELJA
MTAMNKSIEEDEGDPADLTKPEHIGNETVKDFDHPVHGDHIRQINKECERQKRIHGVHIRALIRDSRDITEIIRLHLKTSGYYTQYRRQLRGFMHCYEDDGYIFSHSETEIMELLKKSSIYALNPHQRVKLFNHERESREAYQLLSQQKTHETGEKSQASKSSSKQLSHLRRALVQLNEGRRIQNISEIKERLLDEKNPLPWAQMENITEYMCSTFVIQCPSIEECGKCEELTPDPTQLSADEDDDIQILDSYGVAVSGMLENNKTHEKPLVIEGSNNVNKCTESLSTGEKLNTGEQEEHKDQNNVIDDEGFADVDPLMACTSKKGCPVHNPSSGRLLYFIERDAVKKILDSLNPRGFRESELSENISFFKEIYTKEMNDFLDVWKDRHSVRPLSLKLFGFSSSIPRELGGGKDEVKIEQNPSISDALYRDMISHLLQLEEFVHERRFGYPRCTVDREKWRQALEADGDTTPFCVDNRVSVLHSSHSDILFTPIVKRTPSQTFIDWQRAIKFCQSPSAVALFATTFEYSVNWDYESPLEKEKRKKVHIIYFKLFYIIVIFKNTVANLVNSQNQLLANNNRACTVFVKPRREAQTLLADAADLLVSGPRQRRPVTKYGECEMDLDKIDFGDEKLSESEGTDKETETEEEMENRILDENDDIGESSEGDVEMFNNYTRLFARFFCYTRPTSLLHRPRSSIPAEINGNTLSGNEGEVFTRSLVGVILKNSLKEAVNKSNCAEFLVYQNNKASFNTIIRLQADGMLSCISPGSWLRVILTNPFFVTATLRRDIISGDKNKFVYHSRLCNLFIDKEELIDPLIKMFGNNSEREENDIPIKIRL